MCRTHPVCRGWRQRPWRTRWQAQRMPHASNMTSGIRRTVRASRSIFICTPWPRPLETLRTGSPKRLNPDMSLRLEPVPSRLANCPNRTLGAIRHSTSRNRSSSARAMPTARCHGCLSFEQCRRRGRHDVRKRPQGPHPASPCPSGRPAAGAQGLNVHLDRLLGQLRHDPPAAASAGWHDSQQADQKEWIARGRRPALTPGVPDRRSIRCPSFPAAWPGDRRCFLCQRNGQGLGCVACLA